MPPHIRDSLAQRRLSASMHASPDQSAIFCTAVRCMQPSVSAHGPQMSAKTSTAAARPFTAAARPRMPAVAFPVPTPAMSQPSLFLLVIVRSIAIRMDNLFLKVLLCSGVGSRRLSAVCTAGRLHDDVSTRLRRLAHQSVPSSELLANITQRPQLLSGRQAIKCASLDDYSPATCQQLCSSLRVR